MKKTVKLDTFIENPDNPQRVAEADFALLVESLRQMPQTLAASKIAYVTDYTAVGGKDLRGQRVVVAGNKRLRALKKLAADRAVSVDGQIEFGRPLPAEWFFDLTPLGAEARRRWIVKSNVQSGEWDAAKLLEQYDRAEIGDLMGASALEELLQAADKDEAKAGETDPDAVPAIEEEPKSKRGEIYICGEHRLMCGDATSEDDADALMDGESAAFVFTDPPYGVAIGDKNKLLNAMNGSKSIEQNIKGDTLSTDALYNMLVKAFANVREHCASDASYYVSSPQNGELGLMMMMMMRDAGLAVRHMLIWVKSSPCFSLGRLDYDYRHEPIFYTWTKSHDFHGDYSNTVIDDTKPLEKMSKAELKELVHALQQKSETSVIYCDKPTKSNLHPTMKPVALVARFLRNSSHRGGVVLDAFGGSGTTMIACEQLGRKCRMMELDPHYCDVIRRRWAEFVHGEGCDWEALTPHDNP